MGVWIAISNQVQSVEFSSSRKPDVKSSLLNMWSIFNTREKNKGDKLTIVTTLPYPRIRWKSLTLYFLYAIQ